MTDEVVDTTFGNCSRMWLYKDMYEPNDNDEQED